jgi:hypothetical protein
MASPSFVSRALALAAEIVVLIAMVSDNVF